MKGWTDPNLVDAQGTFPLPGDYAAPPAGTTDKSKAVHMTEVRTELAKASLFMAHLDERPLYVTSTQNIDEFTGPEYFTGTILNEAGAGVIRSIWIIADRIKIYVDDEPTPRVDCTPYELALAGWGSNGYYMGDFSGVSKNAAYLNIPIPYHTRIRIDVVRALYYNIYRNHSVSVDYNYGRYNKFNFARYGPNNSFVGASEPGGVPVLSVSGKGRGALYGLYYAFDGPVNTLEGDSIATVDVGQPTEHIMPQSGCEDLFFGSFYFEGLWAPGATQTLLPTQWPQFLGRSSGVNLWGPQTYNGTSGVKAGMYRWFDAHPFSWEHSIVWRYGQEYVFSLTYPVKFEAHFIYYSEL
jgi:hypothetical protein